MVSFSIVVVFFSIVFQAVEPRTTSCVRCWWESPGFSPSPATSTEVDVDKAPGALSFLRAAGYPRVVAYLQRASPGGHQLVRLWEGWKRY